MLLIFCTFCLSEQRTVDVDSGHVLQYGFRHGCPIKRQFISQTGWLFSLLYLNSCSLSQIHFLSSHLPSGKTNMLISNNSITLKSVSSLDDHSQIFYNAQEVSQKHDIKGHISLNTCRRIIRSQQQEHHYWTSTPVCE